MKEGDAARPAAVRRRPLLRRAEFGSLALDISSFVDILIPVATTASRGKPVRTGLPLAREDRAERLADLFHALSDPTRLRILAALRNGEQCVCNLTGLLVAQQSRLSFHMKTLKDAGLVKDRREGRWIHYSLVPEAVEEIRVALEELEAAARACATTCCR